MRAAYVIGGDEYVREVPDLDTAQGPMRSNNIAEYHGLIFLLRRLREIESETGRRGAYVIHGDSQLVIRQMKGRYRVKADHLRALHSQADSLAAQLDVTFEEIPRTEVGSHQGELNSRPAAYKAAALPTELWWRGEPIGASCKSVFARDSAVRGAKSIIS